MGPLTGLAYVGLLGPCFATLKESIWPMACIALKKPELYVQSNVKNKVPKGKKRNVHKTMSTNRRKVKAMINLSCYTWQCTQLISPIAWSFVLINYVQMQWFMRPLPFPKQ